MQMIQSAAELAAVSGGDLEYQVSDGGVVFFDYGDDLPPLDWWYPDDYPNDSWYEDWSWGGGWY